MNLAAIKQGTPEHQALCSMCGLCCWDWKGEDGGGCEHLGSDKRTCMVHGGEPWDWWGCRDFPARYPRLALDLPPTCTYIPWLLVEEE